MHIVGNFSPFSSSPPTLPVIYGFGIFIVAIFVVLVIIASGAPGVMVVVVVITVDMVDMIVLSHMNRHRNIPASVHNARRESSPLVSSSEPFELSS